MRKRIPKIEEGLEELREKLRREKDPQRKRRLHMLVLLKSGQAESRQTVAQQLAVHRNTVGRWLASYEAGGLAAVLAITPRGLRPGQRMLPGPVMDAWKQRLKAPAGFRGYGEIQAWVQEQHGQPIKYTTLYRIVPDELKAKPKVPRPTPIKKRGSRGSLRPGLSRAIEGGGPAASGSARAGVRPR